MIWDKSDSSVGALFNMSRSLRFLACLLLTPVNRSLHTAQMRPSASPNGAWAHLLEAACHPRTFFPPLDVEESAVPFHVEANAVEGVASSIEHTPTLARRRSHSAGLWDVVVNRSLLA